MLSASEIRKQARENLKNKWSQVVLLTLIYTAINIGINSLSGFVPFLGILCLIITVPFEIGLVFSFIKIYKNETFSYGDLFTLTLDNFSKVWKVVGNILLKLIVPIILLVVSIFALILGIVFLGIASNSSDASSIFSTLGIIFVILGYIGYIASLIFLYVKSLLYSVSYYILYDNPNMTGKQIVEESERIMKGQRGKYFGLQLSFIGWGLLTILTLGIGTLFLTPYVQFATIVFYEDRTGKLSYVQDSTPNI